MIQRGHEESCSVHHGKQVPRLLNHLAVLDSGDLVKTELWRVGLVLLWLELTVSGFTSLGSEAFAWEVPRLLLMC